MSELMPKDCPKFSRCNAPICPLDPLWRTAVHIDGEAICTYALASGKDGAEALHGDNPVFRAVVPLVPELCDRHPAIGRGVTRAARFGLNVIRKAGRQKPVGHDV